MAANKNCIVRLSKYKNALVRLKTMGFVRVFSDNLADAVGVTSAQVRKDFSIFGIPGNKRGGYLIEDLIAQINTILGKDHIQKVIVVGIGNIGRALINYKGFSREGIEIVAGFDSNPAICAPQGHIPIYPLEQLQGYVAKEHIEIAILTVPEKAGQEVADLIVAAGINGILNFTPLRLRVPDQCVVNNVNLGLELETVIYFVHVQNKQAHPTKQGLPHESIDDWN